MPFTTREQISSDPSAAFHPEAARAAAGSTRSTSRRRVGQAAGMRATPIDLYDGPAPGSESWTGVERQYFSELWDTEVVTNVSAPTLVPLPPTAVGHGDGNAVIVGAGWWVPRAVDRQRRLRRRRSSGRCRVHRVRVEVPVGAGRRRHGGRAGPQELDDCAPDRAPKPGGPPWRLSTRVAWRGIRPRR